VYDLPGQASQLLRQALQEELLPEDRQHVTQYV
jgi:hypothetical protein